MRVRNQGLGFVHAWCLLAACDFQLLAGGGRDLAKRDTAVVERHRAVPADPAAGTAKLGNNAVAKPGILERAAGKAHGRNMVPPAEHVGKMDSS